MHVHRSFDVANVEHQIILSLEQFEKNFVQRLYALRPIHDIGSYHVIKLDVFEFTLYRLFFVRVLEVVIELRIIHFLPIKL